MGDIHLVLGGARSGKSRFAEQLARKQVEVTGEPATYVATATASDGEMRVRIQRHIRDRQAQSINWQTIEEPRHLGRTILAHISQPVVLVDCLTLWLSNCLHGDCWVQEREALLAALDTWEQSANAGQLLLVSNETGLGVVPMEQLSRNFVDESGFLHQDIAALADRVSLVVAGLPTQLKP